MEEKYINELYDICDELSRAKSWGDVERVKSMLNDLLERVD